MVKCNFGTDTLPQKRNSAKIHSLQVNLQQNFRVVSKLAKSNPVSSLEKIKRLRADFDKLQSHR
jgi:hypothetical protein